MTPDQSVRALAAELRDMKRRLHALETAPRSPFTSVQNGQTRWLNSAGEPVVVIGVDEEAEDPFVRVYNDDASAITLDITSGVMRRPIAAATWQRELSTNIDSNGRVITSSTSYTTLYETNVYLASPRISCAVYVDLGPGVTSADVRIRALLLGVIEADGTLVTAGGGEQTVKEFTNVTATGLLVDGSWLVPDEIRSPPASPIGASIRLLAQARVAGGAGNVWIHPIPLLVSSAL